MNDILTIKQCCEILKFSNIELFYLYIYKICSPFDFIDYLFIEIFNKFKNRINDSFSMHYTYGIELIFRLPSYEYNFKITSNDINLLIKQYYKIESSYLHNYWKEFYVKQLKKEKYGKHKFIDINKLQQIIEQEQGIVDKTGRYKILHINKILSKLFPNFKSKYGMKDTLIYELKQMGYEIRSKKVNPYIKIKHHYMILKRKK